jgi:hypothetical protein
VAKQAERYDDPMQSIEIDPELNRLALAEAAELYPEFADQASHVMARPVVRQLSIQAQVPTVQHDIR